MVIEADVKRSMRSERNFAVFMFVFSATVLVVTTVDNGIPLLAFIGLILNAAIWVMRAMHITADLAERSLVDDEDLHR